LKALKREIDNFKNSDTTNLNNSNDQNEDIISKGKVNSNNNTNDNKNSVVNQDDTATCDTGSSEFTCPEDLLLTLEQSLFFSSWNSYYWRYILLRIIDS
jgi:hypothetical protein